MNRCIENFKSKYHSEELSFPNTDNIHNRLQYSNLEIRKWLKCISLIYFIQLNTELKADMGIQQDPTLQQPTIKVV